MVFVKGGRPGPGKPKGFKHKKTVEWEALGNYVCNKGVERYLQILQSLPDDKYMEHFEHVLEYFKPRITRVSPQLELKSLTTISKERIEEINRALELC